jgi:hypothetical protein
MNDTKEVKTPIDYVCVLLIIIELMIIAFKPNLERHSNDKSKQHLSAICIQFYARENNSLNLISICSQINDQNK